MAPKPQRLSSLVCWTIEVKLSASNIAGNRPMPFLTSQTANLTAPSTGFSHDERGFHSLVLDKILKTPFSRSQKLPSLGQLGDFNQALLTHSLMPPGSLATFTAMRRASSRVSTFAMSACSRVSRA
jgi:hypothetical protein